MPADDAGADTMIDPEQRLTPLQRRRLREGKPFTSRKLNTLQRKAEDELDHQKEHHMTHLETAHTPFIKQKIENELEDIEERKILRDKEHKRRHHLHIEREQELRALNQAKLDRIYKMEEDLMGEEERLAAQHRRDRKARTEALDRKLRGLTNPDELEEEQMEQEEEVIQKELAAERAFSEEAHRVEAMLDQTVMSEERRLRAMLVSAQSTIATAL